MEWTSINIRDLLLIMDGGGIGDGASDENQVEWDVRRLKNVLFSAFRVDLMKSATR